MRVGIIGSGAWGRALATLVARAGHSPRIGYRSTPPGGFPGTPNLDTLVAESDLTILSVPAESVRSVIEQCAPGAKSRVVIATRGLQPVSGEWLSDLVISMSPCRRVGSLAGPALAAEVVRNRPCGMVVASPFDEVCTLTQEALHSEICRIYTSNDMRGVELSGAMVLVLSMAVGLTVGLDLGIGSRGIVITRGIAEATRLGAALGAHPQTFAGLAGLGDLVSCATHSDHPSFAAGLALARGASCPDRFCQDAAAVLSLAQRSGVEMPLTAAVAAIAAGELSPKLAFDALMRREARSE
jgi:glycerol-3-phosphate dehydrogenase (NAD(P)+)